MKTTSVSRWQCTFLVVLVAVVAFGGSFECRSGDRQDKTTTTP